MLPNSAFTNIYSGIARALHVDVLVSEAGQLDDSKFIKTIAIWDTGATMSNISSSLAQELGLVSTGKKDVKGVHGVQEKLVYDIDIILPNQFKFQAIKACECDDLSADGKCRMLIGMDIISLGDMAVTNVNGQTYLTFRIPSIERVDFVKQAKVHAVKQTHFNKGKKSKSNQRQRK